MEHVQQLDLAFVASRYYLERRSRVEIADELGVSRFRVARMLDEARERGIVRFVIDVPGPISAPLSIELREALGLRRAVVVETPSPDPAAVRQYVGQAAAVLAGEVITPDDVVGMTSGRTLSLMARAIAPMSAAGVVQLSGVAGPMQPTAVEVLYRFSRQCAAPVFPVYAPLLASDPAAARAIRRQHDVRRTLERYPDVTVALVAIGSWDPPDSELATNATLAPLVASLRAGRRVKADVGGVLLTAGGEVVEEAERLVVGASATELRAIPDVIGVAGGAAKAGAILAAVRSGIVRSLVTDAAAARELVAAA